MRKAGLWEMKMLRTGSPTPDMTMQQCTDATTDKEMSTAFSPMAKEICSRQDIQKTATGYVTDSVCTIAGMTDHLACRNHRRFQFRLHREVTSHSEGGPAAPTRNPRRRSKRNGSAPARPTRSPATS